MLIIYRDEIGYVSATVNMEYGISFCDGFAYFTATDGTDFKIPVENVNEIKPYC